VSPKKVEVREKTDQVMEDDSNKDFLDFEQKPAKKSVSPIL